MDYITFSQTIGRVIGLHHNDAKNIRDGKLTAGDIRFLPETIWITRCSSTLTSGYQYSEKVTRSC